MNETFNKIKASATNWSKRITRLDTTEREMFLQEIMQEIKTDRWYMHKLEYILEN